MTLLDRLVFKILNKDWAKKLIALNNLQTTTLMYGDQVRLHIAESAKLNNALFNVASGDIKVEEFVFFGHNVSLLTGTHDYRKVNEGRQQSVPETGGDIVIQQGVWLASNVTIIGPSVIGRNSVVAAGSVVIGNIPENVIVAGNPAKIIKNIEIGV